MNRTDFHELLTRYLSGEATAEERAHIEAWRKAAAENQHQFAEFEKIWQNATASPVSVPDVDQAWNELSVRLGFPPEAPPAGILKTPLPPQRVSRRVFWSDRYVWAAAAILVLGIAALLYRFLQNADDLLVVTTSYAQQETVTLPDGSLVRLNSDSEIRFAKNFADSARYVTLSGEAYFEVTHDNLAFHVNTGNAQIKVLGTKFGIWARHELTRVTVREGRVSLRPLALPKDTAVELAANQMSSCQAQSHPELPKSIDADHLLGWLEGKIVFEQTPLAEVVAELQRVYNVGIELSNPALGANTITGSFHNKPIETVLASICLTMNLQYQQQAGKFVVSE
jgi:ferric-dicitrate binding protein FerR (iron transport regulator)